MCNVYAIGSSNPTIGDSHTKHDMHLSIMYFVQDKMEMKIIEQLHTPWLNFRSC